MSAHDDSQTNRYLEIDGEQIPVTEEVYRAYKRPEWAEHKRQEREKRCRDENGSRCAGDCGRCEKQRTGGTLSLERFSDEGFDVPASFNLAELVADKLLLEQLYIALAELGPDNQKIIELFGRGKSEREIAAEIGLSQKAVNKRKTKLFEKLRERLKNFR